MKREDARKDINGRPLTDFISLERSAKAGRNMYKCPHCRTERSKGSPGGHQKQEMKKIILGCKGTGARYCMTYKKECFILCRKPWEKIILGCNQIILGCNQIILGCNQIILGCNQIILGCNQIILGCGRIKTKTAETRINKGFSAPLKRRRFVIIDNQ